MSKHDAGAVAVLCIVTALFTLPILIGLIAGPIAELIEGLIKRK